MRKKRTTGLEPAPASRADLNAALKNRDPGRISNPLFRPPNNPRLAGLRNEAPAQKVLDTMGSIRSSEDPVLATDPLEVGLEEEHQETAVDLFGDFANLAEHL